VRLLTTLHRNIYGTVFDGGVDINDGSGMGLTVAEHSSFKVSDVDVQSSSVSDVSSD